MASETTTGAKSTRATDDDDDKPTIVLPSLTIIADAESTEKVDGRKRKKTATLIEEVYQVHNKYGQWFYGVSRDDLTEQQMAELGPSFLVE